MVSLSLEWIDGLRFKSAPECPAIDLASSSPGIPSPVDALGYAVASCMAMDLVYVLRKSRQSLQALTVTFHGERAASHPRRFTSMALHFDLTGHIAAHVVERAIELSKTTYCSVWNTIRSDVTLTTTYTIRPLAEDVDR